MSGSTIATNSRSDPAPSTRAASRSSRGISTMNARSSTIANGNEMAIWGRISAHRVLSIPSERIW